MARFAKVFEVWETVDEMGRRGKFIGAFTDEGKAKKAAERRGWYGGEGLIESREVVQVDGRWYQLVSAKPLDLDVDVISRQEELRASALSKLSADERKALGIP